jgi:hypothetical protein
VTRRAAAELVTLPPALLTATVYESPLLAEAAGDSVYELEVAPAMGCPFRFH